MLAIVGDYLGTPVNLAARLVAAAAPGQILAATDVRDELPDWPAIATGSVDAQGFRDSGDGLRPAPVPLMVDLDALEAAGIANARERAGLINYLDRLGLHGRRDGRGRAPRPAVRSRRRRAAMVGPADATACATRRRSARCASRGRRARLGVARPDGRRTRHTRTEPGRCRRPGDLGRDEGGDGR